MVKKSTSFNPAFPNHEISFTSHEILGMYKSLSENEEPEEEKEDGNAADSVLANQIRSGVRQEVEVERKECRGHSAGPTTPWPPRTLTSG